MFQFGQRTSSNNYFELSEDQSSSNLQDSEVETEFSRVREGYSFGKPDDTLAFQRQRTELDKKIRLVADDEAMLFYEDFVKMSLAKRSKSLDQIHTIVLSD